MDENRGVHRSKPGPDRSEPVGLEDRNFEYSKIRPIPSGPKIIFDIKNKLKKMEDVKII